MATREFRLMPGVGSFVQTGHRWVFTPRPDGSVIVSVIEGDVLLAETRFDADQWTAIVDGCRSGREDT